MNRNKFSFGGPFFFPSFRSSRFRPEPPAQGSRLSHMERSKPLLILDLDETLIFASEIALRAECDFRVDEFFVYKRPNLDAFLSLVAIRFDLAIWSSASRDYVQTIADELGEECEWKFVWSRSRCVQRYHYERMERYFIKDLRKAERHGYDLEQMLIVDDTPLKVSRNYGNAVYVRSWEGSAEDQELMLLGPYLCRLAASPNFRTIEKRGWRNNMRSR